MLQEGLDSPVPRTQSVVVAPLQAATERSLGNGSAANRNRTGNCVVGDGDGDGDGGGGGWRQ